MKNVKITRKSFIKIATVVPFLGGAITSCGDSGDEDNTRESAKYEILSDVKTTLTETLIPNEYSDPNILITDLDKVLKSGYGTLEVKAGEAHILDKSLLKDPDSYTEATERKSLLFFPQITDIHLTDVQSPMRAVYGYVSHNGSAYRPQSIYSTHVLHSTIQTINAVHKIEKFNFVLATGDMIDNAEGAELEWFNTIMNGGVVKAVTGSQEHDPIQGMGNDFTDPYIAEGLADDLPWYASIGNHDVLYVGISYITDEKANNYVSSELSTIPFLGCDVYSGAQNPDTEYGEVQCGFERDNRNGAYLPVATDACKSDLPRCDDFEVDPDPTRAPFRNHGEIIDAIKDEGGFNKSNTDVQKGYYSIRPNKDIPLELIFLDLSATKKHFVKPSGELQANQVLTNALLGAEQFNWLKDKLDALKEEGVASIVIHHQPTDHFQSQSEVSSTEYISTLKQYEDVLAIIAGHTHKNKIRQFPAENDNEFPFVEVVTCGLLDFPEQSRIYEVVYNNNGTISLFTTMLDHASKKDSFSYNARRLALAYTQVDKGGFGDYGTGTIDDRNREIIIPISTKLQAKLEALTVSSNYVKSLKIN